MQHDYKCACGRPGCKGPDVVDGGVTTFESRMEEIEALRAYEKQKDAMKEDR